MIEIVSVPSIGSTGWGRGTTGGEKMLMRNKKRTPYVYGSTSLNDLYACSLRLYPPTRRLRLRRAAVVPCTYTFYSLIILLTHKRVTVRARVCVRYTFYGSRSPSSSLTVTLNRPNTFYAVPVESFSFTNCSHAAQSFVCRTSTCTQ